MRVTTRTLNFSTRTFSTKAAVFFQCFSLFLHASVSSLLNTEFMARPTVMYPMPSLRGGGGGGGGRRPMLPLTTACAYHFGLHRIPLLVHQVLIKQQAIMEKEIITFRRNSRLKFSSFFAKMSATNCCT